MVDLLDSLSYIQLFDAASDPLLLVDSAGSVVRANVAAQEMFGYGATEMMGIKVESLMPREYRRQHEAYRHQYDAAPRKRPMGGGKNLLAQHRNGKEIRVDIGLSPMRVQDQYFVLVSLHPNEKQAEIETELGIAKGKYHTLVEQTLQDAILVHDHQGQLLEVNHQACNLLGYSDAELLTMNVADIEQDFDLPAAQLE